MDDKILKALRKLLQEELQQERQSIRQEFKEVLRQELDPIKKVQTEHTSKLDSILGDVIDLQDNVGGLYDLVRGSHEHNQREIKEIKKHLNLPFEKSPFVKNTL